MDYIAEKADGNNINDPKPETALDLLYCNPSFHLGSRSPLPC
jgi:hypothetical protein